MESLFAIKYSYLIPLLPLLGAVISGFLGAKWLKGNSHWPIWLGVGASALLSFALLFGMLHQPKSFSSMHLSTSVDWYTWIEAGLFKVNAGFFFDPLTAVMLCVVTGIGFLITVFAKGYMAGESGYFRFFSYLGLFIFAMTILVMGNNFVMLYLGWEGVGLCSYFLIGYYYERPAAREAAKKAFLVNRIGDFGFGLGIMLIYVIFGSVSFFGGKGHPGPLILATDPAFISTLQPWKAAAINWIPFLLMLGAFGKSAQFPLYVWLPDAMEGPTPVSALIHAATMVTAGVYMIVRCGTLFVANEAALTTIAVVGAFTAIFAGSIALRQFDLKKVFAYSTVSQLGFMFVGVAALAPVAGVFHLVTHAFFKALLFLSSGVVMHATMGELDMRKMSGLKRILPKTRWFMLFGCLALAGMFPLAGFWSKDEIVIAAFAKNKILGLVMILTALMTAYYAFRLYFRVFEGPEIIPAPPEHGHEDHDQHHDDHGHAADSHAHGGHHNHEPLSMMLPLFVLTLGAIFAGALNYHGRLGEFLGNSPSLSAAHDLAYLHYRTMGEPDTIVDDEMFGQPRPPEAHEAGASHTPIMVLSILVAVLGILLAYVVHLQDRPRAERLAARFPALVRLLEAKFYVDEIYQAAVVEPLRSLGRVFFAIDRMVIDGLIWTVSFVPQMFGFTLKLTTQRGSLQGYALMMLLGLAVILLIVFI